MKYKVGDKVRVKSLEWYNENKDEFGDVKTPNNVFVPDMSRFCRQECIISQVFKDASSNKTYYGLKEDISGFSWTDDMFEGLVESELNKPLDNEQSFKAVDDVDYVKPVVFENIVFPNENYADKVELCLGDDYEIVVEDGRTFIQKKKPKYPTTYEECCGILGMTFDYPDIRMVSIDEYNLYSNFIQLIRCRDAYWKLADNWKPDCNNDVYYFYTIKYNGIHIRLYNYTQEYAILAFPTEEMRDAFYENFKDLIEKCKELL